MTETRPYDCAECPRCGGAHEGVEVEPLENPPEWADLWWTCPTTKQPVFSQLLEDAGQQTFAEACAESLVASLEEAERGLGGICMAREEGTDGRALDGRLLAVCGGGIQQALSAAHIVRDALLKGTSGTEGLDAPGPSDQDCGAAITDPGDDGSGWG